MIKKNKNSIVYKFTVWLNMNHKTAYVKFDKEPTEKELNEQYNEWMLDQVTGGWEKCEDE